MIHFFLNIFDFISKLSLLSLFSDSGGGGERVLWMMIAGILQSSTIFPLIELVIYSTTNIQSKEIVLNNVMVWIELFVVLISLYIEEIPD